MTALQRSALARAQKAAAERSGYEVLDRMDPDQGHWSWASSPHVLWLASQLGHVCWTAPPAPEDPAPAPARARTRGSVGRAAAVELSDRRWLDRVNR